MTDEAKALVERLRQVSSVLFDDYGDGTHAVEDYAICGKAANLIETQAREIERLREALELALETHDTSYAWEYTARAALAGKAEQ